MGKSRVEGTKVWKELQYPYYPVLESEFVFRWSSWEMLPDVQI